jgi:murein DD-endopeptidase MepM/ murein hydrolase activator NlpD
MYCGHYCWFTGLLLKYKMDSEKWIWPLPGTELIVPGSMPHPGSFGAIRKHDIHTGIDLYCEPLQEVVAVEDGTVVLIEKFTGEFATPPSPWWHNTYAVLIEGQSGVVVYGEIKPLEAISVGYKIKQGETIGNVITVLKKDKNTPMTMLHLELYKSGTRETVIWNLGQPQPENLLNPLKKLISLK